ncbi:MAG: response regulator transcription factor [Ignavibacteria bacterium]|jgi:DNA-binding LytR/AlgR family response regulator
MNCLAIDDEPLALNVIKEHCKKVNSINLIATYTNAIDAITEINNNKIDLIFLDIEMPKITGLEFIKSLSNPPLIIFTTAFPNHAIDGFELDAVDYLLKPISFEKFLKAVNKASIRLAAKKGDLFSQNNKPAEYLFVKVDYSTVKVSFSEINYVEGLKDYIKIYTNEKPIITKSTIKHMESKLPTELFVRVHKSYIISINKIDKIEYNHIIIGQTKIPIGLQFKDSFYEKIDRHRL